MSQADIEDVRSRYAAVSAGDRAAIFRDVGPGFALQTPDRVPDAGTYLGSEEATRFMLDFWEPFEEVVIEPREFFERSDTIVVLLHARLRHHGSTSFVEVDVAALWRFNDGKPIRVEMHPQPEKALEAAGIQR